MCLIMKRPIIGHLWLTNMFNGDAKKHIWRQTAKRGDVFFCVERRFPCHSAVCDGIRREEQGGTEKKRGLFGGSWGKA